MATSQLLHDPFSQNLLFTGQTRILVLSQCFKASDTAFEMSFSTLDTSLSARALEGKHRFVGIQVKTSSYQPKSGWWLWNITKDDRRIDNLYYVLVLENITELPEYMKERAEDGILAFVVPYKTLDEWIKKSSKVWETKEVFGLSINKKIFENRKGRYWFRRLMPYLNRWTILYSQESS